MCEKFQLKSGICEPCLDMRSELRYKLLREIAIIIMDGINIEKGDG
ncbi:MAG: hypothetical protein WA977_11195 [Halobacteriota archaeon]